VTLLSTCNVPLDQDELEANLRRTRGAKCRVTGLTRVASNSGAINSHNVRQSNSITKLGPNWIWFEKPNLACCSRPTKVIVVELVAGQNKLRGRIRLILSGSLSPPVIRPIERNTPKKTRSFYICSPTPPFLYLKNVACVVNWRSSWVVVDRHVVQSFHFRPEVAQWTWQYRWIWSISRSFFCV
jgi:hypothetical protein